MHAFDPPLCPAFDPVNPALTARTGVEMNKELFVSATPHETKVGMTEDDQLAEIYLERENEYTLAGSIYKGRVTRVLPGMQSAFVDIGLERDAFLYVSDFMELGTADEDLDELPGNRPVTETRPTQPVGKRIPREGATRRDGSVAGVGARSSPRDQRKRQRASGRIARFADGDAARTSR